MEGQRGRWHVQRLGNASGSHAFGACLHKQAEHRKAVIVREGCEGRHGG